MELEIVKEHYEEILWDKDATQKLDELNNQMREFSAFTDEVQISQERIKDALDHLNISKSCGNDMLFPTLFRDPRIQQTVIQFIDDFFKMKAPSLPHYLKTSRLVLLSKDDQNYAQISNTRPIAVQQVITRVIEKLLLEEIKDLHILETGKYQTGFKDGSSTLFHASTLLKSIISHQQ